MNNLELNSKIMKTKTINLLFDKEMYRLHKTMLINFD